MVNPAYIDFLKYCLSEQTVAPKSASCIDWEKFFEFCQKQAIVGVVLDGIDKLINEGKKDVRPPKTTLLEWIGCVEMIRQRNLQLNQISYELQQLFAKGGFRSCVLKGQGNAQMYPNPLSRVPGDIDLWVDGERSEINKYVGTIVDGADKKFKDIAFHYKDVDVEVHYFPTYLSSFSKNKLLQKYISEVEDKQMGHILEVKGAEGNVRICTPTDDFNLIFQISHIIHHFFCEGIGLRHFIDYFYLLKQSGGNFDKNKVTGLFEQFGFTKFASGVMWIESEVLGLDKSYLILEADDKVGEIIWNEIIKYGNFNIKGAMALSTLRSKLTNILKPLRYASQFPGHTFDRLFFTLWLQGRKLTNN